MSPIIIVIAGFVGVAALVFGVALMFRSNTDEKLEDRLTELTTRRKPKVEEESVLKEGALATFDASEGFFERTVQKVGNLGILFEQADTALTPAKFVVVSIAMGAAAAAAVIACGLHPGAAVVAGIMFPFLPLFWLIWRRKHRFKRFGAQLPDALELIARALRAGHSLAAGFQLVGQEMSDPIGKEFNQVFEEQNLGIQLDDALNNMCDRVPNLDLKFFCTAIVLQRQTGGDLAEILDKIGRLIRERFRIWGQVQALTGEGRLSGIVLLALPPLLFLAAYYMNPDYVMILFTDPLGKQMMIGAVVLQVLGALVIRKIVNIKV